MNQHDSRTKHINKLALLELRLVENVHKPHQVLSFIANYFSATSCVLWLRNPLTHDGFKAYAHHNRPDVDDFENGLRFRLGSDNIAAVKAFDEKNVIIGNIGEPPFSGRWLEKKYTKFIKHKNVKHICLSPIFDLEGRPYGLISFYFTKGINHNKFMKDINIVSRFVYFIFSNFSDFVKEIDVEHRKMGHEISASVRNLLGNVDNLQKFLEESGAPNTGHIDYLGDIRKALHAISESAGQERLARSIREAMRDSRVVSFRKVFNSAAQPLIRSQKSTEITLSPLDIDGGDVDLIISPIHLFQLIDNLMTNAIKYSTPGGIIRPSARLYYADGKFVFSLANTSTGIPREERKKIWSQNFRGNKVLETDIKGEGLGLNIVKEICEAYEISYEYKQEEKKNSNLTWSIFSLIFPKQTVDWG